MEPTSHFYFSHRLKLQFWDWGQPGRPPLVLVHGGLDHARSWDRIAPSLREHFHVYAVDLRGHGNSEWARGAAYGLGEYLLDLAALLDVIHESPVTLVGHSLGGLISVMYAGLYPGRVGQLVAIEGLGIPPDSPLARPPAERLLKWITEIRMAEQRAPRSYPSLEAAVGRMKAVNPHLSDDVAERLTLHGTNWNADGSLVWKFDPFVRAFPPSVLRPKELADLLGQIICPTLLFWGMESEATDPEADGTAALIRHHRVIKVERAGHWVHHDRLDLFLDETLQFLRPNASRDSVPPRPISGGAVSPVDGGITVP